MLKDYGQTWTGGFRIDGLADPQTAYRDARTAHEYVSKELADTDHPDRRYNLLTERKRMSAIVWAIKRHYHL